MNPVLVFPNQSVLRQKTIIAAGDLFLVKLASDQPLPFDRPITPIAQSVRNADEHEERTLEFRPGFADPQNGSACALREALHFMFHQRAFVCVVLSPGYWYLSR